jgi:hypothetical protein
LGCKSAAAGNISGRSTCNIKLMQQKDERSDESAGNMKKIADAQKSPYIFINAFTTWNYSYIRLDDQLSGTKRYLPKRVTAINF